MCPARCLGRTVRTPQRRAACRGHNSSDSGCDDRRRPTSKGNCSSAACAACWRPGPWRPCSAACGGGVQSRRVDCVHARSCRPVAETRCVRGRKPASWRHCAGCRWPAGRQELRGSDAGTALRSLEKSRRIRGVSVALAPTACPLPRQPPRTPFCRQLPSARTSVLKDLTCLGSMALLLRATGA
ncbi:ADAMTS-like protein 3 [Suricata suricatta]|uniref:ADAMTS-like protein 3 n=1 Tax=Suricata suricatta TaxID=37032 RepID=UPI0011557248|nr:ADAMTS-like protein 3 [Suricata suricatta]